MKKFLSLALSLAMVFSMFTFLSVGANAVDAEDTYSDYNTIQYKEAVSVISALDIMGGYSGGTFGPGGNLTRGAATKIICNMMVGPTTANRLPAPSGDSTIFFDVPSSHTFAATIAYCAENNFISGYSDGSFHPGDPLSGNAFLKMLLCALGYDQDVEGYRNTSAWATNVVARAVEAGLMDNMPDDFDGRTSLTREQAAELAFETLQADMVEYESNNSTIVINPDGSISSTPVKSNLRTRTWNTSNSNASNINNKGITYGTTGTTGANIVQFAELKFNNLKRDDKSDDFGRPSTKWTWHGDEIGTYQDEPYKVYTGSKDIEDIYNDLGLSSAEFAEFYVNGVPCTGDNYAHSNYRANTYPNGAIVISKSRASNSDALEDLRDLMPALPIADAKKISDGARVEVYYDKDANYDPYSANPEFRIQICATINYAGKVDSVTRASGSNARKITITAAYDPYKTPEGLSEEPYEFETNDFAADDIVSFTFADGEVQSVTKLTNRVESALTRYSRNNSLTVRGGTYSYAGMIAFEDELLAPTGNNVGLDVDDANYDVSIKMQENLKTDDSYVVYINDLNQVMWVEKADNTTSTDGSSGYALVRWMESEMYDTKADNRASLIFTDGNARTVTLTKDYIKDWFGTPYCTNYDDWADGVFAVDPRPIVHYTREDDGSYRLTNRYQNPNTTDYRSSNSAQISSHVVINWDGVDANGVNGNSLQTNSSTIFIINDDGKYTRKVGRTAAPNVSVPYNSARTDYAFAYMDGNYAQYIWFIGADSTVETYSKDITFIAPASRSDLYEDGDSWDETYYTYNAVVAGEIKTIEVAVYADGIDADRDGVYDNKLTLNSVGYSLTPDGAGGDDFRNGVILNRTTQNTSGRYTSGSFGGNTSTTVWYAYGVKAPANGEIELNTHGNLSKVTEELPNNVSLVNTYYVDDDGNITRLGSVYDIESDNSVYVFYTMNEDDQITNIFVCEDNL